MFAIAFDLVVADTAQHHPKGVSQAYGEGRGHERTMNDGGRRVKENSPQVFVGRDRSRSASCAPPGHHGTVVPCRSMKRSPGVPCCARSVSTTCGMVSSTPKGAFGPPIAVRIQPGAISTIARLSPAWRTA